MNDILSNLTQEEKQILEAALDNQLALYYNLFMAEAIKGWVYSDETRKCLNKLDKLNEVRSKLGLEIIKDGPFDCDDYILNKKSMSSYT